MALHNDIDPLPKHRVQKIKNFTNIFLKINPIVSGLRSKLANAIFLLGRSGHQLVMAVAAKISTTKSVVLSFFDGLRPYLAHVSITAVAVIAIASNMIVKYARADYSIVYPEPASEIAVASTIDSYTPLIIQDGIVAEKAYRNSGGAFAAINSSIDTALTSREIPLPDNTNATVSYNVANGDNLTVLSWKFGVKISTLMYLNDIDNADLVKPGQKLKIPPKGYEVSASAIAKKEQEKQLASASRSTAIRNSSSARTASASSIKISSKAGSSVNGYPYGYCTYYVATRRYVPSSWGNARSWLSSAKRAGYSTGSEPVVGAIVQTNESYWGHVAIVTDVDDDTITIAEMNAVGWGKVSRRRLPAYGGVVKGYIY